MWPKIFGKTILDGMLTLGGSTQMRGTLAQVSASAARKTPTTPDAFQSEHCIAHEEAATAQGAWPQDEVPMPPAAAVNILSKQVCRLGAGTRLGGRSGAGGTGACASVALPRVTEPRHPRCYRPASPPLSRASAPAAYECKPTTKRGP